MAERLAAPPPRRHILGIAGGCRGIADRVYNIEETPDGGAVIRPQNLCGDRIEQIPPPRIDQIKGAVGLLAYLLDRFPDKAELAFPVFLAQFMQFDLLAELENSHDVLDRQDGHGPEFLPVQNKTRASILGGFRLRRRWRGVVFRMLGQEGQGGAIVSIQFGRGENRDGRRGLIEMHHLNGGARRAQHLHAARIGDDHFANG